MKKFSFTLLASVLTVGMVLSGCSKSASNGEGSNNASQDEGEKITLTYIRHSNDAEVNATRKQIEAFEKENPNIKINLELTADGQYEMKLRTMLAGNGAPDIIAMDGPNLAAYAAEGVLLPLDEYMNADGNPEDISKPLLESLTYDGKIYAAPLNDSSLAMYYNKKIFEEKGIPLPSKNPDEAWTWDQVLDAARKINDPANGIYGWDPGQGFRSGEGGSFFKYAFLWQNDGQILSPDGSTTKGYLDSSETKEALRYFASIYHDAQVATAEVPPEAFETGKVGIYINGPWGIAAIGVGHPNFKMGEDWDIAPLWKQKRQASPNGSWNMSIYANSKHPKEAWQFINWMTGVEGAKVWYEETKNLPARSSTMEAFPELKEYPMNIFVEQSKKYAVPRPITPAYPTLTNEIAKMFENIVIGMMNVDDAVNDASDKIDDAIAKVKK
ncbi:MAG: hypothetical protein K0R28_905 [Paenibacillus sp.]|jgi:ABC-type glycerol-3-phosphate transport system substrate-binding protein|nr:hypothetical protein [Paenibacillus sp.]